MEEEFFAARLYTGPMFYKYNSVLRGHDSAVKPLHDLFEELCQGNTYTVSAATLALSAPNPRPTLTPPRPLLPHSPTAPLTSPPPPLRWADDDPHH